jgi:pimeloyl-ACP methyl ester carboxylesterase
MEILLDGAKVFAATGGRPFDPARPAVLLVHGAGMDHTVWALQARALAHGGQSVLALDLPGHGRSGGTPLGTIEDMAGWLLRVIDAVGIGRAQAGLAQAGPALVGHSMGALIALETAARLGPRARRLALLGAVAEMKVHPNLLGAARKGDHAAIDMMVDWGLGRRAHLGGHVGGHQAPGLWLAGGSQRLIERAPAAALAADFAACDGYGGAPAAAASITCPTLVLCGADDRMTPPKLSQSLAGAIAGCRLQTIAGAGHTMMLEQPDATLDALAPFLAEDR